MRAILARGAKVGSDQLTAAMDSGDYKVVDALLTAPIPTRDLSKALDSASGDYGGRVVLSGALVRPAARAGDLQRRIGSGGARLFSDSFFRCRLEKCLSRIRWAWPIWLAGIGRRASLFCAIGVGWMLHVAWDFIGASIDRGQPDALLVSLGVWRF